MSPSVKSGSVSDEQEEVRLNRPAFDYIRDNGLYSVEGQQWFFYNRQPIAFPLGAIAGAGRVAADRRGGQGALSVAGVPRPQAQAPLSLRADRAAHPVEGPAALVLGDLRARRQSLSPRPLRRGLARPRRATASPVRRASSRATARPPASAWKARAGRTIACAAPRSTMSMTTATRRSSPTRSWRLGFQQSSSCMSCHVRSTIGPNRNAAASFVYNADNKAHEPAPPAAMRLPVFKIDGDGRVTGYTGQPQPGEFLLPGQAGRRPRALPGARFRLGADAGRERQQRQVANFPACFANEHRLSPTAAEVGPPCGRGGAIPNSCDGLQSVGQCS